MQQSVGTDVLVVRVDEDRMALPLGSVLEILPAMDSSTLPGGPPVVVGVVNLRGDPVPLLSLRARLGLPAVECHPDHHVVVCSVGERRLALWVDRAESVTSLDPKTVVASDGVVATRYFEGIAVLSDGVMFVFDLRSFLDADEILQLDNAMAAIAERVAS
jgi:purine-binding chemotaxis protein CheW